MCVCVCYSDHALPAVPDAVEAKVKSKAAVVKCSNDDDDALGSTEYATVCSQSLRRRTK